jgi:hypothetical protein
MPTQVVVPEIDVLIGCSLWLHTRGLLPLSFSIASGHGIDLGTDRQRLLDALAGAGISTSITDFRTDGPDVTAVSKSEFWQVECKGAGQGKQSTQRNNFDRALASTVSYFIDQSPQFPGELSILNGAIPFLGLALPATRDYLDQLRRRLRIPLRKRLNLWVLLYDLKSHTIIPVAPDESYPQLQADPAGANPIPKSNPSVTSPHEVSKPLESSAINVREPRRVLVTQRPAPPPSVRSNGGESLNREWNVGARHSLYHRDGTFYMPLERFPGAYFDPNGYVLFRTEREYVSSPYLSIGERVNVRDGISSIPGYRKMK